MTATARRNVGRTAHAASLALEVHREAGAIEREWRHLESSGTGTLFQRFDWVDAWLRTVAPLHGTPAAIVLGRLEGQPAFILPLGIRRFGPVTMAKCLGDNHAGYNFGLWSVEGAACIRSLPLRVLTQRLGEALGTDAMLMRRVPQEHDGMAQPLAALSSFESSVTGYSASLEGGMDALLARTGGGSRRRRANQKERRMRELGALACEPATDLHAALAALDFFAEQKALRLAEQGLPNPFAEPGLMDFMRELTRRSMGTAEPLMQLWTLSLAGRTRAVVGAGAHRGRAALQILTYVRDETQPHSPGQVLLYRHIEGCCAAGSAVYDFGIGHELYKDSWSDSEVALRDRYAAFTPAGAVAVATLRLGEGARSKLRGSVLANGLRRAWRQKDTTEPAA